MSNAPPTMLASCGWGETDIEKLMKLNFVIEWDEPNKQIYEAMTLNAKEFTNLIKSPLTPIKEGN